MDKLLKAEPKTLVYLLLSLLTLVAGYAFLRYAYKVTDQTPFTQEIVLIILGTVATIFITALLLNQQTAVEIEKEQRLRFLELKSVNYERLLDLIEEMSLKERFDDKELTRLQFVTHRLALVASADVLKEYYNFLEVVSTVSKDNSFSGDNEPLSEALAALTVKIREDLVGGGIPEDYSQKQIKQMILRNSDQSSDIRNG